MAEVKQIPSLFVSLALGGVVASLVLGGGAIELAAGANAPSLRAELLAAPIDRRLGGDITISLADQWAFSRPAPAASGAERVEFSGGKNLFDIDWTKDLGGSNVGGLGPTCKFARNSDPLRGGFRVQ